MPAQQPTLDGTVPEPAVDYDTWETTVWHVFVAVAMTGRSFVCWKVAQEYDLTQPPCVERDWARLMGHLHRERIVEYDGFGLARDGSACRRWRGTAEAMQGRAA